MSSSDPVIDLQKVPISRVLIPFGTGVLAGTRLTLPPGPGSLWIVALMAFTGSCLVFFLGNRQRHLFHLLFAGLLCTLFFWEGILTAKTGMPGDPGWPAGKPVLVRGRILGDPLHGTNGWWWEMRLEAVCSMDTLCLTPGKVRIYSGEYHGMLLPSAGQRWQFAGRLLPVLHSGNPAGPDYAAILAREGIRYRLFTEDGSGLNRVLDQGRRSCISASGIRETLSARWSGDPSSVSLLKAVCLGDRSRLTEGLKAAYAGAGGMHLLAVSGLHVGLIWWVLHRILGFMVRLFRREWCRALPILCLLWFYAYLTGFSAPVSRAVTMFSLFTLARMLERQSHPLNTIFFSAFLLVVIDPGKLSQVGFQLSYAAILGIALLFPLLRGRAGKGRGSRIVRWIREVTAISVAAQVATLPLVFYYFHQFPTYALLTNLAAIPLLSILIALFVLSVATIWLEPLCTLLARLMQLLALLLNRLMESVAGLPGSLISGIYPDRFSFHLMIMLVLLLVLALKSRSRWPCYGMLLISCVWLMRSSFQTIRTDRTRDLQILHFQGGSLVTIRQGIRVDAYPEVHDSTVLVRMEQYLDEAWRPSLYRIRTNPLCDTVPVTGECSCCCPVSPGVWRIGNREMEGWIVSGTPGTIVWDRIRDHPGSFILLKGEPRIPSKVMDDLILSTEVITDGSNRGWFVERMEARHPPIHDTRGCGAYVKSW